VRGARQLRLAAGIALSAATLAGSSTDAAAAGSQLLLHTSGSNGYSISFGAEGATALLRVGRRSQLPSRSGASSVYVARARLRGTSVKATFGDLGTVSVRFQPSGRVKRSRARRGCRGSDHFTTRFGTFVGNFDFEGEAGYTVVHLRRAKGRVVSPLALECDGRALATPRARDSRASAARERLKPTTLRAGWRLGLSAASFTAIVDPVRGARFFASVARSEGSLGVYRFAFALASPLAFVANDALSLAGVTPPPPFSGNATLQRATNGAKSWAGPLAVSFPGAPQVPLTGSQFKVQLIRGW
jgi:hypothetical protein